MKKKIIRGYIARNGSGFAYFYDKRPEYYKKYKQYGFDTPQHHSFPTEIVGWNVNNFLEPNECKKVKITIESVERIT